MRTPRRLRFDVEVMACDDSIIHKVMAGRAIDLADAVAVLRANRDAIGFAYLQRWIDDKALVAEFDTVWNEAFPKEPSPPSKA